MRGGRPKAPPCPACGKALYKHPDKGERTKKSWPYSWCRNESCQLFGQDQTPTKKVQKRAKQKAPPVEPIKPLVVESPAVKSARKAISDVVKANPSAIAMTCAIMAQELGSVTAANQIIDQFKLTDAFGIQKLELD